MKPGPQSSIKNISYNYDLFGGTGLESNAKLDFQLAYKKAVKQIIDNHNKHYTPFLTILKSVTVNGFNVKGNSKVEKMGASACRRIMKKLLESVDRNIDFSYISGSE